MLTISDRLDVMNRLGRAMADPTRSRMTRLARTFPCLRGAPGVDPFETGERRTLNLGHTLGHALEVESDYALPHGQAVAEPSPKQNGTPGSQAGFAAPGVGGCRGGSEES